MQDASARLRGMNARPYSFEACVLTRIGQGAIMGRFTETL
jgi:hypothetical protein